MAAQRRWSIEETAQKQLEISEKAKESAYHRDEGCALVTAQNVAVAAPRGKQQGRAKSRLPTRLWIYANSGCNAVASVCVINPVLWSVV